MRLSIGENLMQDWKRLSLKCHGAKIHANKIQRAKNKLKGLDLFVIDINSAIFIIFSLCLYYKNHWAKCKEPWWNKFIHGFWTSNGCIRLKLTKAGNFHVIIDDDDLKFFQGNELISMTHVKINASSFCISLGFSFFRRNIVGLCFMFNVCAIIFFVC